MSGGSGFPTELSSDNAQPASWMAGIKRVTPLYLVCTPLLMATGIESYQNKLFILDKQTRWLQHCSNVYKFYMQVARR